MLAYTAEERASCSQILKHSYFKDLREADQASQAHPGETMINFGNPTRRRPKPNPRISHRQADSNSDKSHSQSRSPDHAQVIPDNVSDGSAATQQFFTYNQGGHKNNPIPHIKQQKGVNEIRDASTDSLIQ